MNHFAELSDTARVVDEGTHRPHSPVVRGLIVLLCLVAACFFLWPAYRAFLNIEIDTNEGWNAFFADAAMGRMPLYPSPDLLITNNYPPLSYYIVGGLGCGLGDMILAGRLLSLAAVLGIAATIALAVRRLGGDRGGAWIGAAFFVAVMSRFCERYVGMDDPQLLGQAVMAFGFVGFLTALKRDRGYLAPILLMAFAGFIKHNIIALPMTAFVWLTFSRPREALKCFSAAAVLVVIGFGLCFASFGRDFFTNMLFSREYSWTRALKGIGDLKYLEVALIASLLVGWTKRHDRGVQICCLLMGIAAVTFFLQKTGAGVDANAQFDLIIAVSMGVGLAFTHAPQLSLSRFPGTDPLRVVLLLGLCIPLLPWKSLKTAKPVRLLFDRSFQTEIAIREKAMADSITLVRDTPGEVMCSNYVCYRSGKPFAIDRFNAKQRMFTGALPANIVKDRIKTGRLKVVITDPSADWDNPLGAKAAR